MLEIPLDIPKGVPATLVHLDVRTSPAGLTGDRAQGGSSQGRLHLGLSLLDERLEECGFRAGHQRSRRYSSIDAFVAGSKAGVEASSIVPRIPMATFLPSSTPHWSNEPIPQIAP